MLGAIVVVLPAFALRMLVLERRSWFSGLPVDLARWVMRKGPAPAADKARLFFLKAFFIPTYAMGLGVTVALTRATGLASPGEALILLVTLAYMVDLSFGLAGYLFASNALFRSVHSTNPFPFGWMVCLLCYPLIHHHWPAFAQFARTEVRWTQIAADGGSSLVLGGTAVMLLLMAFYIPATIVFGLRFSNLTIRGIITSGPYRWIKHPAYTAHIANSWIILLVFFPAAGVAITPSIAMVPVAYTVLYVLRMRTEEWHLRADPDYVAYEAWIARHGLWARARRALAGRSPGVSPAADAYPPRS